MIKYFFQILLIIPLIAFSQTNQDRSSLLFYINDQRLVQENQIDQFKSYNFACLLAGEYSYYSLGFIGDNYRRIKIKFISVIPDFHNPMILHIYGKSNVDGNICGFQGVLTIKEIQLYSYPHLGVDELYADSSIARQGVIFADYLFYEDPVNKHPGFFEGKFISGWYTGKDDIIKYDDIRSYWDSWCNNQFYGKWTDYKSNTSKVCNWGHSHIPNSGKLDIGTGEFYPNNNYKNFGWNNYIDLFDSSENTRNKARKNEFSQWWK